MSTEAERSLYVAWRRADGLIVPVGRLTQSENGSSTTYRFVYLKNAERQEDFRPLPGFPELHRAYESAALFPVFANRVMPRDRPDYSTFVEHLDLGVEADPFEVLARSEGHRETDRIEVFPCPRREGGDRITTLFFARGIRHMPGAEEAAASLAVGDHLELVDDPTNEVNSRAMLLNTRTGQNVGWAPDYLLDLLHELRHLNGAMPSVLVEHVNSMTAPSHLRLLCRLTAQWPQGYVPLSGAEFQPLVP